MDPLASFTVDTFHGRVGETFSLPADGVDLALVSAEAKPAGPGIREGGAFSLLFHGPAEPMLEQAIRRVKHPELGEFGLFLVPVGRTAGGYEYEAAFS
jgi:hypothetical protein